MNHPTGLIIATAAVLRPLACPFLRRHAFSRILPRGEVQLTRNILENPSPGVNNSPARSGQGAVALVPTITRPFSALSSANLAESPSQKGSSLASMLDTLESKSRSIGSHAGPRSIGLLPDSRSFLTVFPSSGDIRVPGTPYLTLDAGLWPG